VVGCGEEQAWCGTMDASDDAAVQEVGASIGSAGFVGGSDTEVLALVATVPPAIAGFAAKVGERADGMSEQEHMNELSVRRDSLKYVLSRTLTNLAYFTDQCKSNPSCEVCVRVCEMCALMPRPPHTDSIPITTALRYIAAAQ
jgi:ferredoxin